MITFVVQRNTTTMNLLNFIEQFPDEESCKQKYKEYRDKSGVTCSVCGSKEHYWKKDKWQYECKSCGKRTTLRSGIVMHGSQLPFRYWFIAIHLLTSTKKVSLHSNFSDNLGIVVMSQFGRCFISCGK